MSTQEWLRLACGWAAVSDAARRTGLEGHAIGVRRHEASPVFDDLRTGGVRCDASNLSRTAPAFQRPYHQGADFGLLRVARDGDERAQSTPGVKGVVIIRLHCVLRGRVACVERKQSTAWERLLPVQGGLDPCPLRPETVGSLVRWF